MCILVAGFVLKVVLSLRYGVGMVYYKQEKFTLAGVHFQKALSINPRSSALLCHVGVVGFRFTMFGISPLTGEFIWNKVVFGRVCPSCLVRRF